MPTLNPRVSSFHETLAGHTEYVIATEADDGRRFVEHRRYSAFVELHREIYSRIGLPSAFPASKRLLMSEGAKQRRSRELDEYLRWAVSAAGESPPEQLLSFLGVNNNSQAGIGEAALRNVIAAASSPSGTPRELFLKRVASSGTGGVDAVGGDRTVNAADDKAASTMPPAYSDEFELSKDVYATAFVLASNATQGMYSFSPFVNPQIRRLWLYLLFIVFSQAFVLLCLVYLMPAVVDTSSRLVHCEMRPLSDATREALESAARQALDAKSPWWTHLPPVKALASWESIQAWWIGNGTSSSAAAASSNPWQQCGGVDDRGGDTCSDLLSDAIYNFCLTLPIEMEMPLSGGKVAEYRRLETPTYFYQNVFAAAMEAEGLSGKLLAPLQLVCCVWVTVQVYFVDFHAVEMLLAFRDFNRWLLPLKGETLTNNSWVLIIPLLQFTLACCIVGVSCVITCACTSGFDAVMNSLAFTFISTVAEVFNQPLLKHYASTAIADLNPDDYGDEPIYYLVEEYDEANCATRDDFSDSWYVKQEDKVAGLLTDFTIRHDPEVYKRPNCRLAGWLRVLFLLVPIAAPAACWVYLTP